MKHEKIVDSMEQEFEREHIEVLRKLAPECMVLLKNNGDFPLDKPCRVALYGAGARQTVKGGTGSGDVNVRHYTTVEEGLENAGCIVTTKNWLESYDLAKEKMGKGFFDEVGAEAKATGKPAILVAMGKEPAEPACNFPMDGEGDVCVYVLSRLSGEGTDRKNQKGDLQMTDDEVQSIFFCLNKYPKFMLVLNTGGMVDISPVLDSVENILLLGQLGTVTGDTFADVLFGKAYPSGKLASTWVKSEDISNLSETVGYDDTFYNEGIFVGYRYFDAAGIKPLFPFGYGLGYTQFRIEAYDFQVKNGTVTVGVTVENIGNFQGKEVIRLYYSAPDGKLKKPFRELGAYVKTRELKPNEYETITISAYMEDFASWDTENGTWLLEKGDYVIYIENTPVGVAVLNNDVKTIKYTAIDNCPLLQEWQPDICRVLPEGLYRIPVGDVMNGHFDRNRKQIEEEILPDLSEWTDEELVNICIGKFNENVGIEGIIGNASCYIAGAAGETADILLKKGIGKLVFADGPAGLRLATRYMEEKEGEESLDTGSMASLIPFLEESEQKAYWTRQKSLEDKAKKQQIYYRYASAIPVGMALAQAWNPEIARICGDIVGDEMERFGVNVWLAPALNIQRTPLCGRNFEYYSEDPVLSGITAAAVTDGVQSHKNCAVTIKHFCCNNQETNRFGSNSIVSERALREIYLKGFEICIKTSSPKAVMSSYNLLNGIHTANSRNLLTDVLRGEWGFDGIVMTDWGTTSSELNTNAKYGSSDAALCIEAGNDLIMPGDKEDMDDLISGLGTKVSRRELEICAGRVLSVTRRLSE